METIDVVLLLYKRVDFLHRQLTSIKNQSCVNNIHLHIISNNPEIDFSYIVDEFREDIYLTFIQKHNKHKFLERFLYALESKFKYVIFLDDDIELRPNEIQELWNQKEPKRFKTFFGRRFSNRPAGNFYWSNPPIVGSSIHQQFNYGGPGFSIVDGNIFPELIKTYQAYPELHSYIDNCDDIFISWVVNNLPDWKIECSTQQPFQPLGEDVHASYVKLKQIKNLLTEKLHSISLWKKL